MSEKEQAVKLAHVVLDQPFRDPDDDLSMLSRQFLRSLEREQAVRRAVIEECAKVADKGVKCYTAEGHAFTAQAIEDIADEIRALDTSSQEAPQ